MDPIRIEVFKHLFAAVAEEMGVVLRKSSYSPNIKERRDFSCALFNAAGEMIAQAAHIPVHLGSMPLSVQAVLHKFPSISPGDAILLNDPYQGGTHLPDITLVSPLFLPATVKNNTPELFAFVASRAHHADVGGMTPGSMPIAQEIYQEGLIIPPVKLFDAGKLNSDVYQLILANVRTPQERSGDLWAQVAANQRGLMRMADLIDRYGAAQVSQYMQALLAYAEKMTRRLLEKLPNGTYWFKDNLDDDGLHGNPIPIQVAITIRSDHAVVDFSGSAPQQATSVNAVHAITLSAVYYVFRCLVEADIPNNSGSLIPIQVIAPEGTIVNARPLPRSQAATSRPPKGSWMFYWARSRKPCRRMCRLPARVR